MQESRDHIKTRMLRNASRAWGYSETESESNFDPLVSMLLTACSVELEKISGEIHASRARVLHRLVQILSPDALTGALPAHAVACATPVERKFSLPEDLQFYIPRKLAAASENEEATWKDVFFSPTASFRLTQSSIRFMAAGNTLYRTNNQINKEIVAHTERGKELPANSLWLAIDEPGTSLRDCLFYFDLRNEAGRQLFYHQLPKATWYWNDQPITHCPGYGDRSISGEQLDLETILRREDDPGDKIKKTVNSFYKSQFITLQDEKDLTSGTDNSVLTGMIADCFSPASLQQLGKTPLRWICIDFPQTVSTRLLQDVVCVMNCFPVINRRLHDLTYRLQEIVNIVPLQTDDLFLDLADVSTDEGKLLNVRTFQQPGEEAIAMLMRNGGVGRFDERDAASIIDYLLQLLRDESAAFSTLGNDFMNSEMRQLQQIINKLEQRLFSRQLHREQTPYLVIRNNSKTPWQNVFIHYWSTTGLEGNNIKAGSVLRLYRGGGLENGQVMLVTTTQGGRNKLGNNETVLAYKSALLSRDRLITEADIRAFCHYQLGDRVKNINIVKGIMIHPDQQQGFVRTIDIKIDIHSKSYDEMLDKGEIGFWKDNLKLLLEERSVALLPYRIFIGEAA
jgi:hypothetical protein